MRMSRLAPELRLFQGWLFQNSNAVNSFMTLPVWYLSQVLLKDHAQTPSTVAEAPTASERCLSLAYSLAVAWCAFAHFQSANEAVGRDSDVRRRNRVKAVGVTGALWRSNALGVLYIILGFFSPVHAGPTNNSCVEDILRCLPYAAVLLLCRMNNQWRCSRYLGFKEFFFAVVSWLHCLNAAFVPLLVVQQATGGWAPHAYCSRPFHSLREMNVRLHPLAYSMLVGVWLPAGLLVSVQDLKDLEVDKKEERWTAPMWLGGAPRAHRILGLWHVCAAVAMAVKAYMDGMALWLLPALGCLYIAARLTTQQELPVRQRVKEDRVTWKRWCGMQCTLLLVWAVAQC